MTRYFLKTLQIHITTTTIRQLVETTASDGRHEFFNLCDSNKNISNVEEMKKVLQRVSKLDKNQLLYWDESHTDINAEEINEVVGQDQNHLRWWDSWDGSEDRHF